MPEWWCVVPEWCVVRDKSGHYRSLRLTPQKSDDDEIVVPWCDGYLDACEQASEFNTVAEVMES